MAEKTTVDLTKFFSIGKKLGTLLATVAVINTVGFYFISNTETYDKFMHLLEHEDRIENTTMPYINTTLEEHTIQMQSITSWINTKDNTFAIGLRVNDNNDLVYRAKDRIEYHVYSIPGYDYLFYTDKGGEEKIAGFL